MAENFTLQGMPTVGSSASGRLSRIQRECSFLIFVVSALLLLTGPAFAGPGTPEFWNTDKLTIGVSDNYKLGFEQEFRFADGSMHYEHSDAGLQRKLLKGLSTSLRYRNVVEFHKNETDMEHRPHWNLSAKVTVAYVSPLL